jgi:hypothetical protein
MNNNQESENYAAISKQFEEACADFQVPATRAAAEQILSQFRQIPNVLPICQYILGLFPLFFYAYVYINKTSNL